MNAPVGRPTDYDPRFASFAKVMCELGATDDELAEALGVHSDTIRRWAGKFPEFCAALKVGKEACDDRVERAVYMKAVGYKRRAVHVSEGAAVEYDEIVSPDLGAAKLWLANRRGWREKSSTEITGANGGPVQVIGGEMTPQQAAEAYQQMLKGDAG